MSLKDHFPVIDNRSFDDIVAEARTRIPRYTPEWTDLNESDPGMTLVELFAWLTEMQLYRLARVPELNYLKFLQLIGIELEPAIPASGQVTFPVKSTYTEPFVIIPRRTRITTEKPDELGPIMFETDEALIALTARLNAVQVFDGFAYTDVSQDNEEASTLFEPFGARPGTDSALYIGFDYADDFPETTFNLAVWSENLGQDAQPVQCSVDNLQPFPPAEFEWEYWNGKVWLSLNLQKDESNRFTRSGLIYLKSPVKGFMQRSTIGKVPDPHYWIRARLLSVDYDEAPKLAAVRSNTVNVTQAETISNEVLGGSNGRPDQIFSLGHKPVLQGTLQLELDQGQGFEPWVQVDDFFGSGRDDSHYILNRSTAEVRFGGVDQLIPVANPNRFNNIIAREYRVGGGARGNVPPNVVNTPTISLPGLDTVNVGNLFAFSGGSDEETISQAKARAPQSIKSRERAVTAEDYELLALRSANIARAKAIPLYHPDFPGIAVPGVMSVIVIPDVEGDAPMPGAATLATVCAFLNQRRLLTTELHVLKPVYRQVEVSVDITTVDDADLAEVKSRIERNLKIFFHPLYGGDESSLEQNGCGWPFGGDIYFSMVYGRLFLPGVKRISNLTLKVDGESYPPCCDIEIEPYELMFSVDHNIKVSYDYAE